MIVDDRLETVLRTNVAGKTAARTQLRQLVDLLGAVPLSEWTARHAAALQRVESLAAMLDDEGSAAVLRSVRHRSAVLVYHFAQGGPRTASAAIAAADLPDEDWLALIPRLPTQARGFLRHRSDLGEDVRKLLSRLGVNDFLLPRPDVAEDIAEIALPDEDSSLPPVAPETELTAPEPNTPEPAVVAAGSLPEDGIGAIVRRIEAFRRRREERQSAPVAPGTTGLAPRLPFDEERAAARRQAAMVDLRTDAAGIVVQAGIDPAGMLIGSTVFSAASDAPVRCDEAMARAFRRRQPVSAGRIEIEGAEDVAGSWQADGTPCFARSGGQFTGYLMRLRRPLALVDGKATEASERASEADRLRQLLHELRTPINAIQGFAEVIQQQVFGATPHQYRAMAASIAADAAVMLAGFEEVERLVKLESRALEMEGGHSDASAILARLVEQVSPVLSARNVRLTVAMPPHAVDVGMAEDELERSIWRVLSVIAASVAPAERLSLGLEADGATREMWFTLPASLQAQDDTALFAPEASASGGSFAASAMLGNGFALRLARAEFEASGGALRREGNRILVELPRLTGVDADHTPGTARASGPSGEAGRFARG